MPDRSQEQASFAGGELDPELLARRDLRRYQIGLRRCRNFVVKRSGAVTRAPGTRWIAETKGSGGVRLIPFVFSVNDSFVLEFGNLYIRFFSDQAQVDDGSGRRRRILSIWSTAITNGSSCAATPRPAGRSRNSRTQTDLSHHRTWTKASPSAPVQRPVPGSL